MASSFSANPRVASHPVFNPVASTKQYRPGKVAHYATSGNQSLKDSKQREEHKSKPQCPLCGDTHYLAHCEKYRKMPLENRMRCVKENRVCNNCLTKGILSMLALKTASVKLKSVMVSILTFCIQG